MKKFIQIFYCICCALGSGMIGFFADKLNTVPGALFFTLGIILLIFSITLISKQNKND